MDNKLRYLNEKEIEVLEWFFNEIFSGIGKGRTPNAETMIRLGPALFKTLEIIKERPYIDGIEDEEKDIFRTAREFADIPIGESAEAYGHTPPDDFDAGEEFLKNGLAVWPSDALERRNKWFAGIFESEISSGLGKILSELWRCFCLASDPSVLILCYTAIEMELVNYFTSLPGLTEDRFDHLKFEENRVRRKRNQNRLSDLMFASIGLQKRGMLSVEEAQIIENIRKKRNSFVHEGKFDLVEEQTLKFVRTTISILEKTI